MTEVDAQAFRRTCGLFTTGVTVVTTVVDGHVHGMTANSFTSVSLEPPLVLVCFDVRSKMAQLLPLSKAFTINVLAHDQEPVSRHFAGSAGGWNGTFIPFGSSVRLDDCLAALSCEVYAQYPAGDHVIVLGRVNDIYQRDEAGVPLVFWRGRYTSLVDDASARTCLG
ncbi:flavin reductase family protein [Alicyclobacillus acidocaldarius]|uniref:Flavin reductase domain protein FMN-binding protein n=1 Tax=Alicyclobacillus acidocaldarius (strain Tc-4-1) TaxID=1048834 RepID=F8IL40_ALIAT|nr:flavin reductase family protein [Alicyclobacillus acidocaldarius]AEJ42420.1 flavin reductase domain protein FMN-binding protein [Alicyclobacillus acidocaldarius subsp. acidocaldarius Tc-4-1]